MEQDGELGGGLLGERRQVDGRDAQQWIDTTVAHLRDNPKVQLMSRTLVAGYYDHNVLTALDRRDAAHAAGRIERDAGWVGRSGGSAARLADPSLQHDRRYARLAGGAPRGDRIRRLEPQSQHDQRSSLDRL